jgi:hypothetical protein
MILYNKQNKICECRYIVIQRKIIQIPDAVAAGNVGAIRGSSRVLSLIVLSRRDEARTNNHVGLVYSGKKRKTLN